MMEALHFFEMSVFTRATRRYIPEDVILYRMPNMTYGIYSPRVSAASYCKRS
jgi:hypothetical protein